MAFCRYCGQQIPEEKLRQQDPPRGRMRRSAGSRACESATASWAKSLHLAGAATVAHALALFRLALIQADC